MPSKDRKYTLADVSVPTQESLVAHPVNRLALDNKKQANEEAEREDHGIWNFVSNVAMQDSIEAQVYRAVLRQVPTGVKVDWDWRLDPNSDKGKALLKGIPEDYWMAFSQAASYEHAQTIRQQILDEMARAKELASYGGGGAFARFGLNVLDPAGIAVGSATGGLSRVTRLSRLSRTVLGAGLGASGGVTASELLNQIRLNPAEGKDRIREDALMALQGFLFGGVGGRFMSEAETRAADIKGGEIEKSLRDAEVEASLPPEVAQQWADSTGAARVDIMKSHANTDRKPITEEGQDLVSPVEELGMTRFAQARRSFASMLRGNKDPWVRKHYGPMMGDQVGPKNKKEVNVIGADEHQTWFQDKYQNAFVKTVLPAYKKWGDARGYNFMEMETRAVRHEFMADVGRYVRRDASGEVFDKEVTQVGDRLAGLFSDMRKDLRDAGVKGYETLEEDLAYLPRMWNTTRLEEFNRTYGTDGVIELFRRGLEKVHPDMDVETQTRISHGFVTRLRRMGAGMDAEMLNGARLSDVSYLRGLLDEIDASDETVEYAVKQLNYSIRSRKSNAEASQHAKHRTNFDINTPYEIWNKKTGKMDRVSLSMLIADNAENLFYRYLHTSSGHYGLAKAAGIKSEQDFEKLQKALLERGAAQGEKAKEKAQHTARVAKEAYDLLVGRSLDPNPDGKANTIMRNIRLANVPLYMSQVAWAQATDMGNLVDSATLRATLTYMPEARKMLKRAKSGKLESELANEFEDLFAEGNDALTNTVFVRGEEFGEDVGGAGGSVEHSLRQSGRFLHLASGLAAVDNFMRRSVMHAIVHRMVNQAYGKRTYSMDKLRFLGLSEHMADRVFGQLQAAVEVAPVKRGHRKVRKLRIDKFTDMDAKEAFVLAVRKEARRKVQKNDLGSSHPFMHRETGRALTQFRTFVLNAYEKQTLHALHMFEAENLVNVLGTMVFSSLSYYMQQSIALIGAPEEVREERLSLENILRQGAGRSAYASIIPPIVDSLASLVRDEPVFGYRTSSLNNSLVRGNPSFQTVSNLIQATKGTTQALLNPNVEFSQDTVDNWWRVMFFNNYYGLMQLQQLDPVGKAFGLPEHSKGNSDSLFE